MGHVRLPKGGHKRKRDEEASCLLIPSGGLTTRPGQDPDRLILGEGKARPAPFLPFDGVYYGAQPGLVHRPTAAITSAGVSKAIQVGLTSIFLFKHLLNRIFIFAEPPTCKTFSAAMDHASEDGIRGGDVMMF